VVCALSLAVVVAMLLTGPLAGYWTRRRQTRAASAPPPVPVAPEAVAPPTIVRHPHTASVPKIARLKDDSTTVLPAPATEPFAAPTTTLRIQRREPSSDATTHLPKPPPN
jgi:hypothetical protein